MIQSPEEIHYFAAGLETGVEGHQNCEQKNCEQTGVSQSSFGLFAVVSDTFYFFCSGVGSAGH